MSRIFDFYLLPRDVAYTWKLCSKALFKSKKKMIKNNEALKKKIRDTLPFLLLLNNCRSLFAKDVDKYPTVVSFSCCCYSSSSSSFSASSSIFYDTSKNFIYTELICVEFSVPQREKRSSLKNIQNLPRKQKESRFNTSLLNCLSTQV